MSDIDVKAVIDGEEDLSTFYRTGFSNFMKDAQKRDPEHRHKWIRKSPRNQHLKLLKGWTPVDDKAVLASLGLGHLIGASGRATWDDLELWRMPIRRALAIRRKISSDTAARSQSAKAAMESIVADTKDRSKGKVVPFLGDGGAKQDLVEKRQVAEVTATK